ncbi:hypothetical protein PVK06_030617 [Gossypium arboreum]|uniref:Uncharacterized protein n=1 Tax=Gossypium arboreum TaxID=29729 RepID=A0ABR0NP15_GOSAR|nr:hypothetical protein PVK06_030617 [Gossypium arboreum]
MNKTASYTHHCRRPTAAPLPYSVACDAPKWAFSLVLKHPRETSPQNPKKKELNRDGSQPLRGSILTTEEDPPALQPWETGVATRGRGNGQGRGGRGEAKSRGGVAAELWWLGLGWLLKKIKDNGLGFSLFQAW